MTEEEAKIWLRERFSEACIDKLSKFVELLVEENTRQNLIAKSTIAKIWTRHIVDSAQLLSFVPSETKGSWFDIGSGAGLPGIVIGILDPNRETLLIEPRKKRGAWLHAVSEDLDLSRCRIVEAKIERLQKEKAGIISARAVMSLTDLVTSARPFSTNDTYWILPKGSRARQELSEASKPIQNMFHVEQSVTDTGAYILVGKGRGASS
ncbi:16S rRNA (guanine(527)-N(7))-methyltransferase RsmG [Erythrobacter litoralis]|uniref:16S rRNA (guanine(527)-N(7))-methyltransferase RsmG n=1 Tax=Erythrobacter litoralis TaxID=39960 RepID=UPI002434E0F2|nr:16S rRNA (guanine(527)-N(7))-methyltransferase RsmG [Erythrobacter litoralis]MDG6079413.1 16S rRNA (guanine(527)-N(7))-methyltransferase RsmG [Erythrobacter litoralis]